MRKASVILQLGDKTPVVAKGHCKYGADPSTKCQLQGQALQLENGRQ
jgi:hypothetical protein